MEQFQTWFGKNKVFIIGLLLSIAAAIEGYAGMPEPNWKVIIYAAFTAAVSYAARNLRGQWPTIGGIVLTLAATVYSAENLGDVNIVQLILQAAIAYGLTVAGPPKSIGYEQSPTIQRAKTQGETIKETALEPDPTKNKTT